MMILTKFIGFFRPVACILLFGGLVFFVSCESTESANAQDAPPSVFRWEYASPESQGMSSPALDKMLNTLVEKGTKKLMIIKDDKIVYEWFAEGSADSLNRHSTASLAKALVGGMSLVAAMDDGYISLDESALHYIPAWEKQGVKSKISIRHLATHTSGIEDAEATPEERQEMNQKGLHRHFDLPGWKGQFWRQEPDPFAVSRDSTPVLFTPGSAYAYSNPG